MNNIRPLFLPNIQHVLPAVYEDSLSYYELLGKFIYRLNRVIESINTMNETVNAINEEFIQIGNIAEISEQVNHLQSAANEIQEILDSLPNYAQFTDLSSRVVIKPYSFDSVSDMKACEYLDVGDICHTNGFRYSGDGGGAWYTISNSGVPNEADIIECQGCIASLVKPESCVTLEMLGAFGDGIHNDSLAISRALYLSDCIELSSGKTYLIDTVTISRTCIIKGNGATLAIDNYHSYGIVIDAPNTIIENITLDAGNHYNAMISKATRVRLTNVKLTNFSYSGLTVAHGTTSGYESVFENMVIEAQVLAEVGVVCQRADNIFTNLIIVNCVRSMDFTQGSCMITNVHAWISRSLDYMNACLFKIRTPDNIVVNGVYCDTIRFLTEVPSSTAEANIYIDGAIMLPASNDYRQILCHCYEDTTNTKNVVIRYSYKSENTPPQTYSTNTFLGQATLLRRINPSEAALHPTSTPMRNALAWTYRPNILNTADSRTIIYQVDNNSYEMYIDLTTREDISGVDGRVSIGAAPTFATTSTGRLPLCLAIVGNTPMTVFLDLDTRDIFLEVDSLPTATRITASASLPLYF